MNYTVFVALCVAVLAFTVWTVYSYISYRKSIKDDDHPIDQPDIRLTKVHSEHVRTYSHD